MLRALAPVALALSFAGSLTAQTAAPPEPKPAPHTGESYDALHPAPDAPVPREQRVREALQKLTTTCRVMEVVAHPDDEDGPLLTELARGRGCQVMLFTLTRGEGGQNASGAIFGDELGLLRTMELLAADKVYGADERFSRVADFGFSKTPEESFAKWGGRDVPLGDLVRQIRLFRPDVLIARFSGTPRDGHGHHQASSLLTQEAFHAAADPKRFPEQKLQPWQAKKLYIGNIPEDQATLTIDNGKVDPVLGEAPARIALGGLRHQASQGLGDLQYNPARAVTRLKLVDVAPGVPKPAHEGSLFDGLETSSAAIDGGRPVFSGLIRQAAEQFSRAATEPGNEVPAISAGLADLRSAAAGRCELDGEARSRDCRRDTELIQTEVAQAESALAIAAGLSVDAYVPDAVQPLAAAGTSLPVTIYVHSAAAVPVKAAACEVVQPGTAGRQRCTLRAQSEGLSTAETRFTLQPGPIARVPVHREDVLSGTRYLLDSPEALDEPLPAASLLVEVKANVAGQAVTLTAPVMQRPLHSPVFLAPAVTLATHPETALRTTADSSEAEQEVWTEGHSSGAIAAQVKLDTPGDWVLTPKSNAVELAGGGSDRTQFLVMPSRQPDDSHRGIGASAVTNGQQYTEGVHLLSRADLQAFPYYFPARTRFSFLKVEFPPNLKIGYVMGAGDNIPDALRSLGMNVTLLSADDLAHADLSAYGTIVTGIRAFATRADLRENNGRLLDWVRKGGTMIVQYEQDFGGFNAGRFAPYPLTLGNIRADQEELPVRVLQPEDSVFHAPNTVGAHDFDGWIQERGLYFAAEWSPEYTPLLSIADAGEPAREGALLRARVGQGVWMYSGLAMFRQVPNGVPGATRLFVNLLSAGHTAADAPVVSAEAHP